MREKASDRSGEWVEVTAVASVSERGCCGVAVSGVLAALCGLSGGSSGVEWKAMGSRPQSLSTSHGRPKLHPHLPTLRPYQQRIRQKGETQPQL